MPLREGRSVNRAVRALRGNHGRYAASAPLAARPLIAGGALGTAGVIAVLLFSASSHADVSSSAVGSTVAAGRPSATSSTTAGGESGLTKRPESEVPHFNAVNAMTAAAANAAAAQAAALAELDAAPDAGSVPTAVVDAAQVLASGFVKPVDGVASSPFGVRFHPILHVWKLHSGTDLATSCGTPVKAAKAGQVTLAGGFTGYGNRVVVDHGSGLVTTYNHLRSYAAVAGLQVQQGQIIGYVGSTGMSTGCHLHFEVMVGGAFVDPAPYLDLAPAPKVVIPAAVPARSDVILATAPTLTTTPPVTPTLTPTETAVPTETVVPTATASPTETATTSPTDVPTSTVGPSPTSDPTSTATDPPSLTSDPTSPTSEPSAPTATPTSDPVQSSPTATDPASP